MQGGWEGFVTGIVVEFTYPYELIVASTIEEHPTVCGAATENSEDQDGWH